MAYQIGFDVGGTFTDFTVVDDDTGHINYFKVPSTPGDPSKAISDGLKQLIKEFDLAADAFSRLGHGTTVATNLVIERKGARTGMLTTAGFRDVLEIGRQTRPHLYNYAIHRPMPLVPRNLRLEIDERITADGTVLKELDECEVRAAAEALREAGVKSVVICFLHSYRRPAHERRARDIVQEVMPDVYVSISSDVLPEFREFERMSTTVLNAYMGPRMGAYLERLDRQVRELGVTCGFQTVHSNGGLMSTPTVREIPVRTCLSGPAAGVMGAAKIGTDAGFPNLVTFDVGGTSTDVSIIVNGKPLFASDRLVADYAVKTPMVDIHVIGAGGGSIARIDDAGALKVGPDSAGADPGPVAYGRGGTQPTITDANIALGRLDPIALLNGRLRIDAAAAQRAIEEKIAAPLGLSVEEAAHGILRIACANMNRAIQSVSTEKGHDVRDFALIAFGGAGPLHAADLAAESNIGSILIPLEPGTLCARGILLSDITMDFVRSELLVATDAAWNETRKSVAQMTRQALSWLEREGVPDAHRTVRVTIDARYDGQNYEVPVAVDDLEDLSLPAFEDRFKGQHRMEYGYDIEGRETEIVNCRVQAVGRLPKKTTDYEPADVGEARIGGRPVYFGKQRGWVETDICRRDRLAVGSELAGPAIIEEMSSTTIVHPGQTVRVDEAGNMIIKAA
ncbi:MAG: hydantoinase/oxoprolinase family protein [Pseudomonadota bacterium]